MMKKIFENPVIDIRFFCSESIVTVSGASSYEEKIRNGLETKGVTDAGLTEIRYTDLFSFN